MEGRRAQKAKIIPSRSLQQALNSTDSRLLQEIGGEGTDGYAGEGTFQVAQPVQRFASIFTRSFQI